MVTAAPSWKRCGWANKRTSKQRPQLCIASDRQGAACNAWGRLPPALCRGSLLRMHCCYAPEALRGVGMLRVSRAALLSTPQLVTPIFSFLAVEVDKKGTSRQEIGCGTGLGWTCLFGHAWVDCSEGFGSQGSSGLQGRLTAGLACPQLAAASEQPCVGTAHF